MHFVKMALNGWDPIIYLKMKNFTFETDGVDDYRDIEIMQIEREDIIMKQNFTRSV
jgi:hypothetical protein